MGKHVIVGAGQVGRHLAELLPAQGHEVTVVSRSGAGPENVARIAADATDRDRLIEITGGADALYNVAAPPYTRWPQDGHRSPPRCWPPPKRLARYWLPRATSTSTAGWRAR